MTKNHPPYWKQACAELSKADPALGKLIRSYKGELLKPRGDAFFTLARAIVGQQISVKAAASVWNKLEKELTSKSSSPFQGAAFAEASVAEHSRSRPKLEERRVEGRGEGAINAAAILSTPDASLRACGLSGSKVIYLKSLAQHFTDNPHPDWKNMSDEDAIKWLVAIKGIGRWSAEMFLIFHLMRPDVFPLDDIGVQKGIRKLLGKPKMTRKQMETLGKRWKPWRSVATWYLWRSLDPLPVEY